MATVNVNRNVTDIYYRYKMPRIIAKVEGKGNGIKTVIVNMPDVAKALTRPPTYPTKFFGCELGAQTQFDLKNERFIVNGSHDANKLQDLLDIFVKKFVLCPECDNPETDLIVREKKGTIGQRCIACGYNGQIDMRHKLTTFILKNPPGMTQETAALTPGKKDKKASKDKKDKGNKEKAKSNGQENNTTADHDTTDGPAVIPPVSSRDDDDEEWGDDITDEAIRQRMQDLTERAKNLAFSEDLEKTQQERLDIFYEFVKTKRAEGKISGEKMKEIVAEADRLEVKDKGALLLVELLFNENILAQIKEHRILFLRFTHENQKAQKYLLGGFEQLVGNVHPDALMPKVAHILKSFYDHDIVDEEILLDWDKKISKKYVKKELSTEIHQKAAPFIKWLKEAEEEEESSEDEEENDVEVVYSHTAKVGTQAVPKETPNAQPKAKEEDDDFDIDAI